MLIVRLARPKSMQTGERYRWERCLHHNIDFRHIAHIWIAICLTGRWIHVVSILRQYRSNLLTSTLRTDFLHTCFEWSHIRMPMSLYTSTGSHGAWTKESFSQDTLLGAPNPGWREASRFVVGLRRSWRPSRLLIFLSQIWGSSLRNNMNGPFVVLMSLCILRTAIRSSNILSTLFSHDVTEIVSSAFV